MAIKRYGIEARWSDVVVYNNTAYFVCTGDDPKAPAYEQTRQLLAYADQALKSVGSDKSKLLSTTIWVADMMHYAAMNRAWDEWLDRKNPPSRATGEAKLAPGGWKVEMIMVAACPSRRRKKRA